MARNAFCFLLMLHLCILWTAISLPIDEPKDAVQHLFGKAKEKAHEVVKGMRNSLLTQMGVETKEVHPTDLSNDDPAIENAITNRGVDAERKNQRGRGRNRNRSNAQKKNTSEIKMSKKHGGHKRKGRKHKNRKKNKGRKEPMKGPKKGVEGDMDMGKTQKEGKPKIEGIKSKKDDKKLKKYGKELEKEVEERGKPKHGMESRKEGNVPTKGDNSKKEDEESKTEGNAPTKGDNSKKEDEESKTEGNAPTKGDNSKKEDEESKTEGNVPTKGEDNSKKEDEESKTEGNVPTKGDNSKKEDEESKTEGNVPTKGDKSSQGSDADKTRQYYAHRWHDSMKGKKFNFEKTRLRHFPRYRQYPHTKKRRGYSFGVVFLFLIALVFGVYALFHSRRKTRSTSKEYKRMRKTADETTYA